VVCTVNNGGGANNGGDDEDENTETSHCCSESAPTEDNTAPTDLTIGTLSNYKAMVLKMKLDTNINLKD